MTKKQEYLARACEYHGLNIELNPKIILPSGKTVVADATIAKTKNGWKMWVFTESPKQEEIEIILDQGDGYSSFGNPGENEPYDIDSLSEMFAEWGLL